MTARAALRTLSPDDLARFIDGERSAYQTLRERGLSFDLTRGKPSPAQLDLSDALLRLPQDSRDAHGTDVRNYGGLAGLTELRAIFADLLGVEIGQLVAGGNSSLTMMREVLVDLLLHGRPDSPRPWSVDQQQEKVTFICPVPGYDRHFSMLAHYGIDMVTVPMHPDGPDVAAIEALVQHDPTIKGMWVVPTYANPSGATVTQEVAARLAAMPTAAPDFTIFWDNAYALHHLTNVETKSVDMLGLCSASGHPNRTFLFASTSKITYAGAGVAFLASSPENVAWYLATLGMGSIGPDKVNQLRHAEFFGDADGVRAHMVKHREIIAPKFAAVQAALSDGLEGLDIAQWTTPIGGYFVSLEVPAGTATRVVGLAAEVGIALTPAGSSHPYGADPDDRYIRLAPTFPAVSDVTEAMAAVATCVRIAAAEKILGATSAPASEGSSA